MLPHLRWHRHDGGRDCGRCGYDCGRSWRGLRVLRPEKDPAAAGLIVIGRVLFVADGGGQPRDLFTHVDDDVGEMSVGARERRNQHPGEDRVRRPVAIAQPVERSLTEAGAVDREHTFGFAGS